MNSSGPRTPLSDNYDYDYEVFITEALIRYTFASLIMAAMAKGDTKAKKALSEAFPRIALSMISRGHDDVPRPSIVALPSDPKDRECKICGDIIVPKQVEIDGETVLIWVDALGSNCCDLDYVVHWPT